MWMEEIRAQFRSTYNVGRSEPSEKEMVLQMGTSTTLRFFCSDDPVVKSERLLMERVVRKYIDGRPRGETNFRILEGMKITDVPKQRTLVGVSTTIAAVATVASGLYHWNILGTNLAPLGTMLATSLSIAIPITFGGMAAFFGRGIRRNKDDENDFVVGICRAVLFESRGDEVSRDYALERAVKALSRTHFGVKKGLLNASPDMIESIQAEFRNDIVNIVTEHKESQRRLSRLAKGDSRARIFTKARAQARKREQSSAKKPVGMRDPQPAAETASTSSFLAGPPAGGASPIADPNPPDAPATGTDIPRKSKKSGRSAGRS